MQPNNRKLLCSDDSLLLHCKVEVCCNVMPGHWEAKMASAKLLRRQAAGAALLAKRTHDEESRHRCEQLERMLLYLAELEEQVDGVTNPSAAKTESAPPN
jgi:hypothetical protein